MENKESVCGELMKKIAKLIDVKSIVTFALIGTLCALSLRQDVEVPSEALVAIVTAVVTYFFTRQSSGGGNDR